MGTPFVDYWPDGIQDHNRPRWERFFKAITMEGHTFEEAGDLVGLAAATQAAWARHLTDIRLAAHADERARQPADEDAPPKPRDDLCPQARRALEDFDFFRSRYFGMRPTPWQKEAAERLADLLETPFKEYVVVNCPPGSGKSQLFAHDFVLWMLCRKRDLRCMVGSRTERQASQYVARLRRTISTRIPVRDAQATLMHDFGSFRPMTRDIWRANEFVVAQPGVSEHEHKEPSAAAYGYDSAFLGGRFDLVVWDDLVDSHSLKSLESREVMIRWWHDEAETRVEPKGLFILQGQRLDANDLYRHALNLKEEDGSPRYTHIKFPAHDESRCKENHGTDTPYWPDGCLLDPVRVPWKELAAKRIYSVDRFMVLFQQEDVDEGASLVRPIWIDGGADDEGHQYPGCWDSRAVGQFPALDPSHCVSMVGVDPSPTRSWGLVWFVYDMATERRHLIDLFCGPMTSSDFLDLNYQTGNFGGIMARWQAYGEAQGFPIDYWLIEQNAAQRFLLQTTAIQRFCLRARTTVIPHTTSSRKRDPSYGPQILGPLYREGLVRLPGRSRDKVVPLVEDVLRWHPNTTFSSDSLMAQWFCEANLEALAPRVAHSTSKWVPSWLGGSRAWVVGE